MHGKRIKMKRDLSAGLAASLTASLAFVVLLPQAILAAPAPLTKPVPGVGAKAQVTAEAPLDKMKCQDLAADQTKLKNEIVARIREGQSRGAHPAIAYGPGAKGSVTALVDQRAQSEAALLSSSLFAAMQNPNGAAAAASEKINAHSNRRLSIKVQSQCEGQPSPTVAIENQKVYESNTSCPSGGDPASVSIEMKEVYQTNRSAAQTRGALAQAKATDRASATYTACFQDARTCASSEAYGAFDLAHHTPALNKEYFIERTNTFPLMSPMKNRFVAKTTAIPVCESNVYLLTRFNVGRDLGFDHTSQLELVARIGGKTIVISSLSQQSSTAGSWPLWSARFYNKTKDGIFSEYAPVAQALGATDRPVNGEVAGGASDGGAATVPVAGRGSPLVH